MSRLIKTISLTPEQEYFVRQTFDKMKNKEIYIRLRITKNKLDQNLAVMGLKKFAHKNTQRQGKVIKGFFDSDGYGKTFAI